MLLQSLNKNSVMVVAYRKTLAALFYILYFQSHKGQKATTRLEIVYQPYNILIINLYCLICKELPSDVLYIVKLCWQTCITVRSGISVPLSHT